MPVVTQGEMKRLDEYMAGQLASDVTITGGQITGVDVAGMIDVTAYGAKGDGITDCRAAFQLALDENPNATIFIPRSGSEYVCSGEIILTNSSGKNFQGNIVSDGATVRFTNAGSSSDTDADMQRGFTSWARVLTTGGDTSGWSRDGNKAVMSGLIIDGPAHGAGFRLCNSIDATIEHCRFKNQRYGIAAESTINAYIRRCNFYNHINAAIGFIYTTNANIRHGGDGTVMFNDGYTIEKCGFDWGNVTGALAFILDYGTFSEANRIITGCHSQGANDKSGVQYGYLGRGVLPTLIGNWWENVKYPVRIVSSNSAEGGGTTTLTGVTGAEPNGTFKMNDMPDTYSFGAAIIGNFVAGATIAFQPDCNGAIVVMNNLTASTVTADLKSDQGAKTMLDLGNKSATGTWTVVNSYGGFLDVTKLAGIGVEPAAPTIVSGFGTGAYVVSNGSSSAFLINVGTGGTASSGVIQFSKAAPNGWVVLVNNITTRSTTVFQTLSNPNSTSQCTLKNFNSSMVQTPWAAGDNLQCVAFNY